MLRNKLSTYKSKKVLITGNTGFKGSWLSQWLLNLGAEVFGMALDPPTNPSLFFDLNLDQKCKWFNTDIRNFQTVKEIIGEVKPDFIFHLAAQSLIRTSYESPLETLETNIMGTVNLLEAIRQTNFRTNLIVVTSDKCYENQEWLFGYREIDPLGGYDPYSASKGAAEIVVSSYRRSFFNPADYEKHGVKISAARAGNVIGGGDWSVDRIVPDCIRFLQQNKPIEVRNPMATRPWQHVLEPLGAYLILGVKLMECQPEDLDKYCSSFNFGPIVTSNKTVELLVQEIIKNWGTGDYTYKKENAVHEANLLNISIDKAYHLLNWSPVWGFNETLEQTISWYRERIIHPEKIVDFTNSQIEQYTTQFRFANSNTRENE